MNRLVIEKDIIIKRLEGIEAELSELRELSKQPLGEFSSGVGYKLAHYHLHRALEGVFNISSHILSRLPGGQATQYKEMALKLGEFGIVPKEFAERKLVLMAKYRNRLVHFYAQIEAEELYNILRKDLGDFEIFLVAVKNLLAEPERYKLQTE